MESNVQDIIGWLLEGDNPSVEYLTLRDLLGLAEDDSRVVSARQKIMQTGPVPMILQKLNGQGHYIDATAVREYGEERAAFGYLPKYQGTDWQLLLFADLGADGSDPRVRATCDYVLEHSWMPNGLFSMVGNRYLAPCFQGNMLYALSMLGYGDDARVKQAFDVLIDYTRFDDGAFETPNTWPYRGKKDRCSGSHSCYAGCLKALKAVAIWPREKWDARTRDFVARGAEYFLRHHLYRSSHSPVKLLHRDIDEIVFPTFVYGDFVEVLTTLALLGIKDTRMQDAIDLLTAKQLPNGRWRLERDVPRMHVRLGRRHHESKWATYRARHALKLWNEN